MTEIQKNKSLRRDMLVTVREANSKFIGSWRGAHKGQSAVGGLWKRAFDIIIGGIGLLVLAPILLLTAGLVRLLLGKPVISADVCVGYGCRPFVCYAFRADAPAAEDRFAQASDPRSVTDAMPASGAANDRRWGHGFGEMLRASGLEKLPRLLNVVLGDMSLIGPRPITARERTHYRIQLPQYFLARPGLTGLWRRSLPTTGPPLAMDRYYIRHCSPRLDLLVAIGALSGLAKDR